MSEKTSLERAIDALRVAQDQIETAQSELSQLDRCPHIDYPYGVPPVMRCMLDTGHDLPHRYPELSFMDGGKAYHDMTIHEQLEFHRSHGHR